MAGAPPHPQDLGLAVVRGWGSFLWLAYLAAEVVLLVWVADRLGWAWTVVLLAMGFLLGVVVMRMAGGSAFRALMDPGLRGQAFGVTGVDGVEQQVITRPDPQAERRAGRALGRSALLFVAGGLLATPGFISDVVGLLLLPPFTRSRVAARLGRSLRAASEGGPGVTVIQVDQIAIEQRFPRHDEGGGPPLS